MGFGITPSVNQQDIPMRYRIEIKIQPRSTSGADLTVEIGTAPAIQI
jgi:hypothetical protein